MGVSVLKHWRNEEILEEARVEPIAMVMRRRSREWFEHVKRRDETENTRAVVGMKMDGKRPRGRPRLRWKDTVRRHGRVEDQGRMGLGERERSPQDPQPCIGRQDTRNFNKK